MDQPLSIDEIEARIVGPDDMLSEGRRLARRAIELGNAGEHIVCADLIIQGHRAYQASQGLPYDIVADCDGELFCIAVKSTSRAVVRPERENKRVVYNFSVGRSKRDNTGKTDSRGYTSADVDIVAFCALNLRLVAYIHLSECGRSVHFEPPNTPTPPKQNVRGLLKWKERKTFEFYTFERALQVHRREIPPLKIKGRE
ncbi:MAG: group I intron-associated PD-(D/E)XK endonuclease [Hyphomicrobium sp.]